MMKVFTAAFLIVATTILGADSAYAFMAYHPHSTLLQSSSHLHQRGVNQLPSLNTDMKPSSIRKTVTTRMSMAGVRKKLSEMTEEEKIAEKEKGELLLKAKGAAFLVAALAFYLSQQ